MKAGEEAMRWSRGESERKGKGKKKGERGRKEGMSKRQNMRGNG